MIAPSNDPRWERLRKAVALEPVDKVPVCLEGVAWSARVIGMTLKEYPQRPAHRPRRPTSTRSSSSATPTA